MNHPMKEALLTCLFLAMSLGASRSAPEPPADLEFKATPTIRFDREQALKEGVSLIDANKQVRAFFESHPTFTLDDLKSLGVATRDGRSIKLSQIAVIEVTFRNPAAESPAEPGGAGQGASRSATKPEGGEKPQQESGGSRR